MVVITVVYYLIYACVLQLYYLVLPSVSALVLSTDGTLHIETYSVLLHLLMSNITI